MSRFWEKTEEVEVKPLLNPPTMVITMDEESQQTKLVNLDSIVDPLLMLDYSDFSIANCIKHGISYKSLNISPDMRFGYEDEFKALEKRFDDIEKQMSNPKES